MKNLAHMTDAIRFSSQSWIRNVPLACSLVMILTPWQGPEDGGHVTRPPTQ